MSTQNDPETADRGYRDEERLRELYHGQDMTTREIADKLGCTNGTISRWLNRHDIEARPNWKEGVEAAKEANRVEYVQMRTLEGERGYEYWGTKVREDGERTMKIMYVHRLLAIAEYGFDAVADMDVHHKNGIPWDNRPENVVPVDSLEHASYHSNQRWGNDIEELTADVDDDSESVQITLEAFDESEASA